MRIRLALIAVGLAVAGWLCVPLVAQMGIQTANLSGFYPSIGGAANTVLVGNGTGSAATFTATPTVTSLTANTSLITPAWIPAGGTAAITGSVTISGKTTSYNGVTSVGWGRPAIYGYGDVAAATNTGTASIATYTVGAADGTFEVGCNILITTATTHSFSCDVTYTDEGSGSRTMILPVYSLAGTPVLNGLIINTGGTVPYETATMTIRAKAGTAITVRTSAGGTYTTVVYNARGVIKQVG